MSQNLSQLSEGYRPWPMRYWGLFRPSCHTHYSIVLQGCPFRCLVVLSVTSHQSTLLPEDVRHSRGLNHNCFQSMCRRSPSPNSTGRGDFVMTVQKRESAQQKHTTKELCVTRARPMKSAIIQKRSDCGHPPSGPLPGHPLLRGSRLYQSQM